MDFKYHMYNIKYKSRTTRSLRQAAVGTFIDSTICVKQEVSR